jgi:RNA polymerase-binding transcription factor DksA
LIQEKDMRSVRTLTTSQLDELEAELRSERVWLGRAVRSQRSDDGTEDGDNQSTYDVSNNVGGPGIGLTTKAGARLEAVDAALARLAEGTYGICSGCNEHMPFGRLIVMPESALCMACGRV